MSHQNAQWLSESPISLLFCPLYKLGEQMIRVRQLSASCCVFRSFFFVGTEWSWSTPCVVRVLANCSRQKQPVMWFHICDFIRVLKSWLTTHPPNAWEILGFTEFSNPSFMVGSSYEKTGTARHGLDFQGGNQSLHPDVHYFKAQGSGDSPRCLQNLHPSRCPCVQSI
jgi:hypothetical protein